MIQQLASLVCFVVIIFNQNGVTNAAVCPAPAGCPPEYRLDSYQYRDMNGVITSLPVDDGCERVRLILERLNSRGAPSGQVRASLSWDNINDLDGDVRRPGSLISFYSTTSIDANSNTPYSSSPIEYTVFTNGQFAEGSTLTFRARFGLNRAGVDPTTAYILIESYGKRQLLKTDLNRGLTTYHDFTV